MECYFAEVDDNNVVVRVLNVPVEQKERGHEFLSIDLGLGGRWIETCKNTWRGENLETGVPLRKNFAGPSYFYDSFRDAFIPPKPFDSWLLDEETCDWIPPTPRPEAFGMWEWDEESLSWKD